MHKSFNLQIITSRMAVIYTFISILFIFQSDSCTIARSSKKFKQTNRRTNERINAKKLNANICTCKKCNNRKKPKAIEIVKREKYVENWESKLAHVVLKIVQQL